MNEVQKRWVTEKQLLIKQAHKAGCTPEELFFLVNIITKIAKNNNEVRTCLIDVLEQIELGEI